MKEHAAKAKSSPASCCSGLFSDKVSELAAIGSCYSGGGGQKWLCMLPRWPEWVVFGQAGREEQRAKWFGQGDFRLEQAMLGLAESFRRKLEQGCGRWNDNVARWSLVERWRFGEEEREERR